jgi:uncharacterized repeat protein (TIGR01451 family)
MKRIRWLAVVAVAAALVFGTMSLGHSTTPAGAASPGPAFSWTPSVSPGTIVTGTAFDVQFAVGTSPNAWVSFGVAMEYDNTIATVTGPGANVPVTDPGGVWAGQSCSATPPNMASTAGGALANPPVAALVGCVSGPPLIPTTNAGNLSKLHVVCNNVGTLTLHMLGSGDVPNSYITRVLDSGGTGLISTYAPDLTYQCVAAPPALTVQKTAATNPLVAGQPESFTLTVTNTSGTATATGVVVTDTLPAAFVGFGAVTFSGAGAGSCGYASPLVTCNVGSLAPLGVFTVNVDVAASDSAAGNTSPQNCADATETNALSTTAQGCVIVSLIPPAVAWQKSPTDSNVWLCDASAACTAQSVGQQTNVFKFDEIMVNQGDPNGLGAFSFDIHWDVTQYQNPCTAVVLNLPNGSFNCNGIDLSPAVALFAAAGRTLNCTITIPINGIIHVACASTGTWGQGPVWVGSKIMAHVTMTPQDFLVEAIRPNKENGDVSVVKDDQVTVTNTCGQPLNDNNPPAGSTLPGNPDCQGNPLQGVGPGGLLNISKTSQTIRRLEGDITKDCTVDVSDMQLEASKFGQSIGGLLYHVFYDVNLSLQHGDGEIDINDIQFIFGRNGSECSNPTPPQPTVQAPN